MEKEALFTQVKSKLGATQLSDQTIRTYVEQNLPAEGTEPDDAYYTRHVAVLKALEGQFNKDVGTAVTAKVEDFKKNYKPKPGEQTPPPPANEELEKMRKELDDQKSEVAKLKETYEAQIKQNKVDALREGLKNKAESLNVTNAALWNDIASTIEVKDDSTSETLLEAAKKSYEEKLKAYVGAGAAPYRGDTNIKPADVKPEDRAAAAKADADRVRKTM